MPKRSSPQSRKQNKLVPVSKKPVSAATTPDQATGVESPVAMLSTMAVSTRFAGPLPPPEILKQYNDAVPDAAERILRMAEQQATHRQQLEAQVVTSDIRKSYIGIVCAFLLAATAIVTGGLAVHAGHGWSSAAAIVGLPMAAIVGAFIYGTNSRREERTSRVKALAQPADAVPAKR